MQKIDLNQNRTRDSYLQFTSTFKMMSDVITSKILQNSLILENICRYVTFKDHLKLVYVSEEFRDTLVDIVWRSYCKELIITERIDNYLLQFNGSDFCLKQKIFFEFLEMNKSNVKKLELRNCEHIDLFKAVEKCQHLLSLRLCYCKISNLNMELMATNCQFLKSLIFDRCKQSSNTDVVLGRDIKIKTLAKCPNLKELSFYNRFRVNMNYDTVHEILKDLRLSKFSINTTIIYEGHYNFKESKENDSSLEAYKCLNNLSVGRFSNRRSWASFVKLHLPHFCNLSSLSIYIDLGNCVLISDSELTTIYDGCTRLCELSFRQCKFKVRSFNLSLKLERLKLEWCWGVTWKNLKQILNEHYLQSFTSINIHYNGDDVNLFHNANSLQTFTLETSLIKDIVEILCSPKSIFPNVLSLNWINSSESCNTYPELIRQDLAEIFPKLQKLHLEQSYIHINDLQKMKYLRVLQFSLFELMSWSYMLNLLQCMSLTHLTVDISTNLTSSVCSILHSRLQLTNSFNMNSSLKFLKIPLEIFKNGLSFWLDFVHKNYNLKLMFYSNDSYKILNQKFLVDLIKNEKFPEKVKSINICNKYVDCYELLKNSDNAVNFFEFVCNSKGQYYVEI